MVYMLFMEYDIFNFPCMLKVFEYHKGHYRSMVEFYESECIDYKYFYCPDKISVVDKIKELVTRYDLSVRDSSGTILAPEFYSCDSIYQMMEQGVI